MILERPAYRKHHASGKWEVRFYLVDGAQKFRKFKGGFSTRKAAEFWYTDYRQQVEGGLVKIDESTGNPVRQVTTLQELADQYDRLTKSTRRPRSHETEMLGIRNFVSYIGAEKCVLRLSKADCESYLADIPHKAIKSRRREMGAVLRLFEKAVEWRLIPANPAKGIKLPKPPESEVVYLSTDQQSRFIDACRSVPMPQLYPLVVLALRTGMRKQELFNLRWQAVDFDRGRIHVQNTDTHTTKSGRNRVVPLDAQASRALREWQEWLETEQLRSLNRSRDHELHIKLRRHAAYHADVIRSCRPKPDRLVFPSFANPGHPLTDLRPSWDMACEKAGVNISLHDLRHTFAVMCAFNSVPLPVLQKILGHASITTTMIYLRFYPDDALAAVNLPPV